MNPKLLPSMQHGGIRIPAKLRILRVYILPVVWIKLKVKRIFPLAHMALRGYQSAPRHTELLPLYWTNVVFYLTARYQPSTAAERRYLCWNPLRTNVRFGLYSFFWAWLC